jgi:signal transduction histidine kinase
MALTSFAQLGVGVRGMRERVGQLGGVLVVQSDPGSTVVTATLPIRVTTIVTRSEEVV